MSLLDKLKIGGKSKAPEMPQGLNYTQRQEWIRAQNKKLFKEQDERTAKLPTLPAKERPCPICEKPMIVPVGTIKHCHAECKPRYKRAVARIAKK